MGSPGSGSDRQADQDQDRERGPAAAASRQGLLGSAPRSGPVSLAEAAVAVSFVCCLLSVPSLPDSIAARLVYMICDMHARPQTLVVGCKISVCGSSSIHCWR